VEAKMQKLVLPLALLGIFLLAGCRLSNKPEGAAPTLSSKPMESVQAESQPPAAPPQKTPPAAEAPTVFDYLETMRIALTTAEEAAKQGDFAALLLPEGSLVSANSALSFFEAHFMQSIALNDLLQVRALISAQKNQEAATVVDNLIIKVDEAKQNRLPALTDSSTALLEKLEKNLLSGDMPSATKQAEELIKRTAATPSLQFVREVRADLQDASAAAARHSRPIAEAVLAHASESIAKLEQLLRNPEPASAGKEAAVSEE
jgi:hypothetical protein